MIDLEQYKGAYQWIEDIISELELEREKYRRAQAILKRIIDLKGYTVTYDPPKARGEDSFLEIYNDALDILSKDYRL